MCYIVFYSRFLCDGLKTRCTTDWGLYHGFCTRMVLKSVKWSIFKENNSQDSSWLSQRLFTPVHTWWSIKLVWFSQPEGFVGVETGTLKWALPTFHPASPNKWCSVSFPKVRAHITLWLQKLTPGASLRHLVEFLTFQFTRSLSSFRKNSFFHLTDKLLLSTNHFLLRRSYWAPTDFWALCWLLKI